MHLLLSYCDSHRSNKVIHLFGAYLIFILKYFRKLILWLRSKFSKNGFSLFLFIIWLLECILQSNLFLDLIIVLPHNIVHLFYHILALRVSCLLRLMSLQLLQVSFFVLLLDFIYLVGGVLNVLFSLASTDPDFRGIYKPNGPVLVLAKFCTHFKNFLLMDFLNIECHFETLLQAIGLVISRFKKLNFCSKLLEIVNYFCIYVF